MLNYLNKIVDSKDFSYRTFGTTIEEHLTDVLVKMFRKGGFIKSNADYAIAPNKNYFPDLELKTIPHIAINLSLVIKTNTEKKSGLC